MWCALVLLIAVGCKDNPVTKKIKETFPEAFDHLYTGFEEVDFDCIQ